MTTDAISPDLKTVLRRLKLGRMLDTLPERFVLARQQKMPHQDFLTLVSVMRPRAATVWPSSSASSGAISIRRSASRPGIRPPR